ncbi:hypothetical protein RS130_13240 [Paraglaciecola aquimarina]|uniref:Uncharacterized protein n=1 Tax=Paraglaciecola aquimarina TaxID=1235557 RepID=A0ABU3SXQ3_9ALTE|nr:hypothetical protein [Paraglaciecola aquimarina]MDU0354752.1 hypothetical protein [Paraglaciecola aquimarina]
MARPCKLSIPCVTTGMPAEQALGRIGLYPASSGGIGMAILSTLSDEKIQETYENHPEIPSFQVELMT